MSLTLTYLSRSLHTSFQCPFILQVYSVKPSSITNLSKKVHVFKRLTIKLTLDVPPCVQTIDYTANTGCPPHVFKRFAIKLTLDVPPCVQTIDYKVNTGCPPHVFKRFAITLTLDVPPCVQTIDYKANTGCPSMCSND